MERYRLLFAPTTATTTLAICGRTRQIHRGLVRQLERLASQTHHLRRDVAALMVLC
nr:MAG TPA: hypothetical protein [Caudoviricetes sp.]